MNQTMWGLFAPYSADHHAVLDQAKQMVFESGEFRGSELKPATKEEAFINAGGDGTGSILDIVGFGDYPEYCVVSPLTDDQLIQYFGTTMPTRTMIEENPLFMDTRIPGQGIYILCYEGSEPTELFFGGIS